MKLDTTQLEFCAAQPADLPAIISLLAEDPLGKSRESASEPLAQGYLDSFASIDADPNHELIVVRHPEVNTMIGTMQLSYIPYLTYQGSWRLMIEGVRVIKTWRGQGIGHAMMQYAIACARHRDCNMVQLTSNKSRTQAQKFYQHFGFVNSHEGYKLHLTA